MITDQMIDDSCSERFSVQPRVPASLVGLFGAGVTEDNSSTDAG